MSVLSLTQVRESETISKRGRFAVSKFCGWKALLEYLNKCPTLEVAGLYAILFETGCRISEALMLHRDMFVDEGEQFLTVYNAPVLKKKVDAPRGDRYRNIPILKSESLYLPMMDYVNSKDGRLFTKSRVWAWKKIVGVDERWWPHRIRSERATQLHVEYGYQVPELMKFFNWSEAKEALEYVKLDVSDLKEKMQTNSNRLP